MKCLWILLLSGCLFTSRPSGAESISEQLKVADCAFKIQYKGKDVQVLDQKITLRAIMEHKSANTRDGTQFTSGAGLRAYHLEFAYAKAHIDVPNSIRRAELLNDKGKLIHTLSISQSNRSMSESERSKTLDVRYLVINLEGVPLVLLDDVVTIDLKQ